MTEKNDTPKIKLSPEQQKFEALQAKARKANLMDSNAKVERQASTIEQRLQNIEAALGIRQPQAKPREPKVSQDRNHGFVRVDY